MKNENNLFNPPLALYADEELEAWGELYCKLDLYARGEVPFVSFMALSVASRRRCLRAALNHPRSGVPAALPPLKGITTPRLWRTPPGRGINPSRDLRATPAGGVSEQKTPAAGAGAPSIGPVTRHL